MKKVIIITARAGFPNGYGASSIIRKYTKGFYSNGYNVHVMLLRPSEYCENQMNYDIKGNYKEATFEYMGETVLSPKTAVQRMLIYGIGLMRCCGYLLNHRREIEVAFFYSPDYLFSVSVITALCRLLDILCIGIKTESSFCDIQRTRKKTWKIAEKFIYTGFDKMVVISNYIKKQVEQFGYSKTITVLPIVVDEDMFVGKEVERKKEIIYMGALGHKEEIHALLCIAQYVEKNHQDWKLVIIGGTAERGGCGELQKHISVEWLGRLTYDCLAERLVKAGIMVLPRSKQEYSNAGFPIKLGEYLLTGAPVLATDVGEISHYLKDRKDLYLVSPDNMEELLLKLEYIICHYEEALKVGNEGKLTAIKLFGSRRICEEMLESAFREDKNNGN